MKSRTYRKQPDAAFGPATHRIPAWYWLGVAAYRFRWQLTPLYVALGTLLAGWLIALVLALVDVGWTIGVYAVALVCALAWMAFGVSRPYDRAYGTTVVALTGTWTVTVATHPGESWLYGTWALGWPVVGLGWWCGPAFRSGRMLDRMRKRWTSVAGLTGLAGAKLASVRTTPVGRVLSIVLPGDKTVEDVNGKRIEAAYGIRPGSTTVVRNKANARRIELHILDRDPWARGKEIPHPAVAALPHLEAIHRRITGDTKEVA